MPARRPQQQPHSTRPKYNRMLAQDPTRQISTQHIGGLSAILDADVQLVIWKRRLPAEIQTEMTMLAELGTAASFIALATDPVDRIRHQLGKAKIRSQFLQHELSLLVTAFGELTNFARVRVWLGPAGDLIDRDLATNQHRLLCSYSGPGLLLPASQPRSSVTAAAGQGDPLPQSLRMFSASSLRTLGAGQAVLWKQGGSLSCLVTPLPAVSGSLLLGLDRAG
ncbi:MAG: DUF1826 domain-containing protein [Terrimicrobiaceae bacterium]